MKKLCICLLAAGLMVLGGVSPSAYAGQGGATINGDVNCDGGFDMSDAIYTLSFIFLGGEAPCPLAEQPGGGPRIEELEEVVDSQAAEIAALRAELVKFLPCCQSELFHISFLEHLFVVVYFFYCFGCF